MANRVDILIFGATGYTGQFVVEELARRAQKWSVKWAIAGRTTEKLKQVLQKATKATGIENLTENVDTVIANITDRQSLLEMCQRTKVLIDCVGPYRLYGEPVVQACIEARTHYVDISGEPQFLETMQLRYNEQATERQTFIIGSCGFDSLIADLGVELIRDDCEKTGKTPALIESFLEMNYGKIDGGLIHYATWESAVYGFSHANELRKIRRSLFPEKINYSNFRIPRKPVFSTTVDGKSVWAVPFPGSDKSVVQRSQYFLSTNLNKKPIRFQPYFDLESVFSVAKLIFFGLIFTLFTSFRFGINLLLKYPKLFSGGLVTHEGPSRSQCEEASFRTIFVTYTEEKDKLVHEFCGREPGYIATSQMLVGCALHLLKENDRFPVKGGVITPAVAFAKTNLANYLSEIGVRFSRKS